VAVVALPAYVDHTSNTSLDFTPEPQPFADAVGVAALILALSIPQKFVGTADALEGSVQVAAA